jgi:putative serine protease PepD
LRQLTFRELSGYFHRLVRLACDALCIAKFERFEVSDYNRQFVFENSTAPTFPVAKKLTIRERLNQRATMLTGAAILVIGAAVGGAVGAGVGIGVYNYWTRPAPVVVNNADSVTWVTAAAAAASPSVATVSVSSSAGAGNGSGVFLSADGYLLTNTHVVTLDGASSSVKIEVKTFDGHVYTGTVVGTDPTNDLAVIKVTAPTKFTPIVFADSSKINVGDSAVAIGAPLGLSNTVTKGIISALNRTIQVASSAAPDNTNGGGLQLYSGTGDSINLRVIQTDAAINPGNSGGALLNDKGQLIGINVAIANAGGTSGSIGVGFAIPSDVASRIASEIIKTGHASHALLGAMVTDSQSSTNAASFGVGAKVVKLTPGGAAEKGGLKVGDVVTQFNGVAITSAGELTAAVRQEKAGSQASLQVLRGGNTISMNVVLGDAGKQ